MNFVAALLLHVVFSSRNVLPLHLYLSGFLLLLKFIENTIPYNVYFFPLPMSSASLELLGHCTSSMAPYHITILI